MSTKPSRTAARLTLAAAAIAVLGGAVLWQSPSRAQEGIPIPPPAADQPLVAGPLQKAVLAGGCFWGVQAVFQHTEGVTSAVSGYAGGTTENPTYQQVGTGATGHAESVEVTFDPAVISYGEILQIYFSVAHDPTQLNRQGPDTGTQYRSAIFTADDEQARIAADYVAQLDAASVYDSPIVTQIAPLQAFYPAEDYHQDFLLEHPDNPYIVYNDLPKLENLQRLFPEEFRETPVRVHAES